MARTNPGAVRAAGQARGGESDVAEQAETMVTTAMVFVFVAISSVFFLLVDQMLSSGVKLILGLGG